MRISIIIPVLNEAERIEAQVRYLAEKGGDAVAEILVVDAHSEDETASLAAAAGARVLQSPVRSRATQMNLGARAAQTDVLYFVHADTVPPESYIADIQATFEAGYVMGCFAYRFDKDNFWLNINGYFNRYDFLWCQGGDKTFFIKKEIFEELGGYNERFVIMEEYDFLRRAMPRYKLFTVQNFAIASSRKYLKNGWTRVQIANIITFNMFRLGVSPVRMKQFYKMMVR